MPVGTPPALQYSSKKEKLVTSLKSQVSSLKSQVSSLKSQVSSLKSQVSSLKSQVSSLKSQVSSLKSQVSSLKSQKGRPKVAPSDGASLIRPTQNHRSLKAGLLASCLLSLASYFLSLASCLLISLPPTCTAHLYPFSFIPYPLSFIPYLASCNLRPGSLPIKKYLLTRRQPSV